MPLSWFVLSRACAGSKGVWNALVTISLSVAALTALSLSLSIPLCFFRSLLCCHASSKLYFQAKTFILNHPYIFNEEEGNFGDKVTGVDRDQAPYGDVRLISE